MRTPLIVDGRNVILENDVEGFTLIQLEEGASFDLDLLPI
jgi:hypothetical protein